MAFRDWFSDVMQRDMERLLGDFARRKPPSHHFLPHSWEPAMDVYETPRNVVVVVELAGVKEDEIEVVADRQTLHILGNRKDSHQGETRNLQQLEIYWGPFERAIALPCPVNPQETQATFHNGLLEVVLPKAQKREVRQVKVKDL